MLKTGSIPSRETKIPHASMTKSFKKLILTALGQSDKYEGR